MEYKDLERVNSKIIKVDIKGKPYSMVNERISAFRELYPEGCIETELISNENGMCVIKANIYSTEGNLLATGLAYEKESVGFINKTSYIENCETSAVGRALGMLGIGIDTSIASYEEVDVAIQKQDLMKQPISFDRLKDIKELIKETESDEKEFFKYFKIKSYSDINVSNVADIEDKLWEKQKKMEEK